MKSYVEVRSSSSPNVDAIKEVLGEWLGEDEFTSSFFVRGLKQAICTYEAMKDGEMVGVITAWKSKFHPYCTYFSMVTQPSSLQGLESDLFDALLKSGDVNVPLQTSVWETSYRLKTFYEQSGFLEVRRTYTPSLRVSKVDIKRLFPECSQDGLLIMDLKSISDQQELKVELINLVKSTYEKTHTVNPVAPLSLDKWERLIFNEDTILGGSFILVKNNEILAYALLHDSETPNRYEFGWRGSNDHSNIPYMLMLTAHQINFAHEKGIHTLEAEVDSTDPYSIEMLKFFPFAPAPSLLTFQKELGGD